MLCFVHNQPKPIQGKEFGDKTSQCIFMTVSNECTVPITNLVFIFNESLIMKINDIETWLFSLVKVASNYQN